MAGIMQVRPNIIREAALLLADLAGQPERAQSLGPSGFVDVLTASLNAASDEPRGDAFLSSLSYSSAPFLTQLQSEDLVASSHEDALAAYAQRLSFGIDYEGLYWPVDLHV